MGYTWTLITGEGDAILKDVGAKINERGVAPRIVMTVVCESRGANMAQSYL